MAIRLVTSRDGGRTWGPPSTALQRKDAFQPTVAFDGTGALGLAFYDWSRDVIGDDPLTTDAWWATSQDDGVTWHVEQLDGPFDLRAAYQEGLDYDGYALGAYQDLVGLGRDFGAAYTVGPPLAGDGRTDVRFARFGG